MSNVVHLQAFEEQTAYFVSICCNIFNICLKCVRVKMLIKVFIQKKKKILLQIMLISMICMIILRSSMIAQVYIAEAFSITSLKLLPI